MFTQFEAFQLVPYVSSVQTLHGFVLQAIPGTYQTTNSLCSRNFQNVKLNLTLLKFDHFTATQILHEIKFQLILSVQKYYFSNFKGSEF